MTDPQQFDLGTLIAGLKATSDIAKRLEQKIDQLDAAADASREDMVAFRGDLAAVKEMVSSLNRTLHHANGRESVMTRLFTVERELEDTKRSLRGLQTDLKTKSDMLDRIDREGRWKLWIALVGGVFGLAGSAIALLG